jgi:hypothetical protein
MSQTWKLKRLRQCEKCPWKKSTDPHDIPNGYSVEMHEGLRQTIADPGSLRAPAASMACHEHPPGDEVHCVGWLAHQLGPGNNIGLRLRMLSCENARHIQLDGPQHETFEATLPRRKRRPKRAGASR